MGVERVGGPICGTMDVEGWMPRMLFCQRLQHADHQASGPRRLTTAQRRARGVSARKKSPAGGVHSTTVAGAVAVVMEDRPKRRLAGSRFTLIR